MKVKALRLARDLRQAELAAKAKLTREFVNRIEGSRQDPSLTTINALAKALGVSPASLLEQPVPIEQILVAQTSGSPATG